MKDFAARAYRKFTKGDTIFELWRLGDQEYRFFRERSFPVRFDGWLTLKLDTHDRLNNDLLLLPKVLVALEEIFGPSSTHMDTYKQTFTFPLLLRFTKPSGKAFPYILSLYDYKGGLEFKFYRIVDYPIAPETWLESSQEPVIEEFSSEDYQYWVSYLWGYLHAASKIICELKISTNSLKSFFRFIDSSHIIYGYIDGQFFEDEIEDYDEYHETVAELNRKYGETPILPVQKIEDTQEMLEAIWG